MLESRVGIPFLAVAAVCLVPRAASAWGAVHTVGAAGSDFTSVSAAVAAAADGDTILVRGGTYAGFTLDGKGVSIVAEDGADVRIASLVRVTNLASPRAFVLARVLVSGASTPALLVTDSSGSVRVEDCHLRVWPDLSSSAVPAVSLQNCGDVAFFQSDFLGGTPLQGFGAGGEGLRASASKVALHACSVQGAPGPRGITTPGGPGGAGLAIDAGELCASQSTIQGGPGGDGGLQPTGLANCAGQIALPGGVGGAGLVVTGGAVARSASTTLGGGLGGVGGTTSCGFHALDGLDGGRSVGPLTVLTPDPRTFTSPSLVREGALADFVASGAPGERVFLFLSNASGWAWSAGLGATVLVHNPFQRRVLLGTIGASGTLSRAITMPDLGPGVASGIRHLQALAVDAAGQAHLGRAWTLVVVDRAY